MVNKKTLRITELGVLMALILILTFTPIGMIPLTPAVSATTVHIPTIIGSILLGPGYGAVLGAFMGIASLLRALFMPASALDPLFINPLVSVLPRIFVGLVPGLLFKAMRKFSEKGNAQKSLSIGLSAAAGTLTNTILVLSALFLIYPDSLGVSSVATAVWGIISTIIAVNGLTEIISAVVISIPVVLALLKVQKSIEPKDK